MKNEISAPSVTVNTVRIMMKIVIERVVITVLPPAVGGLVFVKVFRQCLKFRRS